MRITYILLIAFVFNVSARGLAQTLTLRTDNATMKEVFNKIHRSTGYNFIYNVEMISSASKVSVELKNVSLPEALKQILQPYGLSFTINDDDRSIVVIKSTPKAHAPPIQVKGVVTDESKQPLPGVNIRVKGGGVAAVTAANGQYTINVPDDRAVLVFSMVGFETREVQITGNTPLSLVMKQISSRLDDIVVIGYGTQRKSDLTGSVAGIKEKEIQQAKSVSFMEAMQGRLAGVQVTSSSGEPGSAVNVTIRGTNSFNSGTQPLYVIDGVQIDVNNAEAASSGIGSTALTNPLSGINPNDIASIEVLKDASATAIFGSRGANGVILITTKTGKSNTSSLEVNTYGGLAWNPKHIQMLGAQDYASYRLANGTADGNYADDLNNDQLFDVVNDRVKDLSGVKSQDWQKEALRTAAVQSYNVSYSGGNAKTNFLTSASYLNQQGLIVNNKYERYGLLMKINHSATDRLKLGTNINLSHALGSGVASNGGNDVRNYNGLIQNLLLTRPVNAPDPTQLALDPDGGAFSNPVDFANLSYKRSPLTRILTDINANYRIINGLNFDTRAGAVMTFSKNGEFYPSTVSWGFPTNGLALLNTSNTINWYQSSTLNYNKRFAKNHSLTALLGFEINSYQQETYRWQGQGFDIQNINPLDNIATANVLPMPASTDKQRYIRLSEFARINYAYKSKYLLTATLRNDASSKLSADHKSALFPSLGLAWRVSEEGFMKKQSVVSDLKFRGSYGLTGNERIPPYQSLATLSPVYYSNASNTASLGYAPNTIANPNLTWETTYAYDAGLDLSLWKDRISLTADVYLKQTKDLLIQADIPSQSGFMRQYQNLGQIDNKGIELALNTINIRKGSFSWTSNINISMNRNKVVSLGSVSYIPVTVYGGAISTVGRVIVGQPIGTAYGYVSDGIYQLSDFSIIKNSAGATVSPSAVTNNNLNTFTYTVGSGVPTISSRSARPGDLKYKDLNNDGVINDADKTVISNSNPKHYGGISNGFTYKNFDLNVLFNWSYGNDILNLGRSRLEAGQSQFANVTESYWFNRWTVENPSNEYPRLNGQGKLDVSSYYTEDGSYLRLRNVTLGYNINNLRSLKKIGINGLRLYVTGVNLHTWTKYSGFDPEITSYSALLPGVDNISYPRERSVIFGLNIKF
ncbi:TonB-dependent receptor [Mucilaginibacter daejeonensis]|uniref:TonB-dependent receptor n=1 Tax=Mucilaginibacter daejeonensis TaxID=398049 RepID=UPI001D170FED|nr:TonB-dependent receptor [Mucilaginibacter daejeonensis]UEG51354.1 TonB-dependent receptor [Mucilaginibacter daejeonensis]